VDWSRPSPSSRRLAVCGPVQSNLPFGLDWTEPYPRLGPSGLVESLIAIVPQSSVQMMEGIDWRLPPPVMATSTELESSEASTCLHIEKRLYISPSSGIDPCPLTITLFNLNSSPYSIAMATYCTHDSSPSMTSRIRARHHLPSPQGWGCVVRVGRGGLGVAVWARPREGVPIRTR